MEAVLAEANNIVDKVELLCNAVDLCRRVILKRRLMVKLDRVHLCDGTNLKQECTPAPPHLIDIVPNVVVKAYPLCWAVSRSWFSPPGLHSLKSTSRMPHHVMQTPHI